MRFFGIGEKTSAEESKTAKKDAKFLGIAAKTGVEDIPKKTSIPQTVEGRDDIPMVHAVLVGTEETVALPPATNPECAAVVKAPSKASTTKKESALVVPSGAAVVQASNTKTRKVRLRSNLGRQPHGLKCPHCNRETITIVDDRIGMGTILATIALAILFWPLCWLPFCMPSCKQTVHFCGHEECRRKVGVTSVCA